MARPHQPLEKADALERFLEVFPTGYFKDSRSISKSLAMFCEALESGRVITIDVRRRGWVMKSTRNPRVNLERWIKRRGLNKSEAVSLNKPPRRKTRNPKPAPARSGKN